MFFDSSMKVSPSTPVIATAYQMFSTVQTKAPKLNIDLDNKHTIKNLTQTSHATTSIARCLI